MRMPKMPSRSAALQRTSCSLRSQLLTLPQLNSLSYTEAMIQGLVQLFLFQALGELLSKFALPFIPGPVLGLVLLLAFLALRGHVPASMDMVGSGILQHLGLLFIPASVGVVLYLPVLQANAWALSAALVVSVLATVAVTAGLLKVLAMKETTDE
jgi:holin-like protein